MPRRLKKDAWAVIAYSDAGWRVKDICNKLNCSRSWVYFIKKKFKETGTVENRLRSGRPHKISPTSCNYYQNGQRKTTYFDTKDCF